MCIMCILLISDRYRESTLRQSTYVGQQFNFEENLKIEL